MTACDGVACLPPHPAGFAVSRARICLALPARHVPAISDPRTELSRHHLRWVGHGRLAPPPLPAGGLLLGGGRPTPRGGRGHGHFCGGLRPGHRQNPKALVLTRRARPGHWRAGPFGRRNPKSTKIDKPAPASVLCSEPHTSPLVASGDRKCTETSSPAPLPGPAARDASGAVSVRRPVGTQPQRRGQDDSGTEPTRAEAGEAKENARSSEEPERPSGLRRCCVVRPMSGWLPKLGPGGRWLRVPGPGRLWPRVPGEKGPSRCRRRGAAGHVGTFSF